MDNNNLDYKACPLCGEERPEGFSIFFDGFVKLYRCHTCSFVASYPGPGHSMLETNYEDSYSLDFVKKSEFMYPQRRAGLQDIVDRINAVKGPGKILNIGCGDGHFLHLCALKGFNCHGLEYSKKLSAYASS